VLCASVLERSASGLLLVNAAVVAVMLHALAQRRSMGRPVPPSA
jgi:hypothetical protein